MNASLRQAYEQWSSQLDALVEAGGRLGQYSLTLPDGTTSFHASLRESYLSAAEADAVGRCHIGLLYPWEQRRVQLADPSYESGGGLGFSPLRLEVSAASMVAMVPGAARQTRKLDFALDTGAEFSLVPSDVLVSVGAPAIAAGKTMGQSGPGLVEWRAHHLVALTNGDSRLQLDPWVVWETPLLHGILGRDILSRCHLRYPVNGGKLELVSR